MSRGSRKRDALVAAAAELFWKQGYAATSIADIAEFSGVPVGNVYYYFQSKSALALAVSDVFVSETETMLEEVRSEFSGPRERLSMLVSRLARSLRSRVDHGCPIALCIRDFRHEAPEASNRAAEAFTLLIAFMAAELGRAGMRPALSLGIARGALAEWQGGMTLAHALGDAAALSESFRRMEQHLVSAGKI
jgi:AcrR family transcriptional regulator